MSEPALEPITGAPPVFDTAQVATMRETWTSLGLDPVAFDAVADGGSSEPRTSAQGGEDIGADAPGLELTLEQAQEMAAALRAAGVPEGEIAAAMAADGYEPGAADERTEEERAFDAAFGAAEPQAYKIDYMGRIPESFSTADLAELNELATTWLRDVGFPQEIGPAVIERLIDVSARLKAMEPAAQALWTREQEVEFERLAGGPEKAAERREAAAKALALGRRDFTRALTEGGAIQDAGVQMFLALHWERLAARGS